MSWPRVCRVGSLTGRGSGIPLLKYMKVNSKNRSCGLEEAMQKYSKETDELKGRSRNSDELDMFCLLRMTHAMYFDDEKSAIVINIRVINIYVSLRSWMQIGSYGLPALM